MFIYGGQLNQPHFALSAPYSVYYMTRSLEIQRIKKPMSLAKIRDQLNQGYYAVMTEAGMKSFLQDLALIESNCIRFNGVRATYGICGYT